MKVMCIVLGMIGCAVFGITLSEIALSIVYPIPAKSDRLMVVLAVGGLAMLASAAITPYGRAVQFIYFLLYGMMLGAFWSAALAFFLIVKTCFLTGRFPFEIQHLAIVPVGAVIGGVLRFFVIKLNQKFDMKEDKRNGKN